MPEKEKDRKSSKIKESQRVKTDKGQDVKSLKKRDDSGHRSKKHTSEDTLPSKRGDASLPDSKKVQLTEELITEVKKSSKSRHPVGDDSKRSQKPDDQERRRRNDHDEPKKSKHKDREEKDRKHRSREYLEEEVEVERESRKHKKSKSKELLPDEEFEALSSTKSPSKRSSNIEKPHSPDREAQGYNYDDDFEQDYQDDFEDDNDFVEEAQSPPTPVKFQKSSPQPSEGSKRTSSDTYESDYKRSSQMRIRSPEKPTHESRSYGLNFKAAIQRSSKLSRRAADILRLVTFDITRVDFFDFPEVSEYDRYIMSYGKATRKQAGCQTFDDAISREIQTEKLHHSTKWTQNPPNEDNEHSGVDIMSENPTLVSRKGSSDDNTELVDFMRDAGSAVLRVLEDFSNNNSQVRQIGGAKRKVETKFGAIFGSKFLGCSQAIAVEDDGYYLEQIIFPYETSSYLISLHVPKDSEVDFHHPHKIIIWNTFESGSNQKSIPKAVFSSRMRVTCVTMEASLNPELLFVGHIDGSLDVWDLRSSSSTNNATFRSSGSVATSSAVFTASDTHLAPLKCLLPLSLSTGSSLTESQAGLRCELLSLDESGLLATWAVADLGVSSTRVMNDDPSMVPGGRIRLLRSSSGNILPNISPTDGLLDPTCILSSPNSQSRVLIGLSSGDILHVARYGGRKGGLGLAHPSIFARKYVSPVLCLEPFLNSKSLDERLAANNDLAGAFIASTAIGFAIYVTSRSQAVLNFDVDPSSSILKAFPISTVCSLGVLDESSTQGILATVAALTSSGKIYLYQIGPKFSNMWSGASAHIQCPSSGHKGAVSQSGNTGSSVLSMITRIDWSEFDEEDSGSKQLRYLTALAFPSGKIDLFLSEPASVLEETGLPEKESSHSKNRPNGLNGLVNYLLTVV